MCSLLVFNHLYVGFLFLDDLFGLPRTNRSLVVMTSCWTSLVVAIVGVASLFVKADVDMASLFVIADVDIASLFVIADVDVSDGGHTSAKWFEKDRGISLEADEVAKFVGVTDYCFYRQTLVNH